MSSDNTDALTFAAGMRRNTSQHILNTAANLLGFCLFVITLFHTTDRSASSFVDDFTTAIALLLAFSCFFSFLSIRSKNPSLDEKFETAAEYIFLVSLSGIIIVILMFAFSIMH